ncbi:MAG: hypothetical protein JXA03_00280 [Bacteroidales bacterium]|nr:hypothetical protein [Bacteroidales bacterium]
MDLLNIEQTYDFKEQMFQAYYDCRKNKRNTINALKFEKHLERNLFELIEEIETGTYQPGRSIAFIVNNPVKREVFAADFRDRVVHHWLINRLNPYFEKIFIFDSYACRINKGTHFGIKRVNQFIKDCSDNFKNDCYILKLDVCGFFMHINRNLLFERLELFIDQQYQENDKELVKDICYKSVFNDPTKNCIIKGSHHDWKGLPKSKSLFSTPENCGLPIGNLTSQVFANFYMNPFDHFIKKDLGIKYYGRYVDDFVIVHPDRYYLKALIPQIRDYLKNELQLELHPDKMYLQHFSKGVKFLGAVIKPHRMYIAGRTKGNFYRAIEKHNKIARDHKPSKEEKRAFLSSMNSYLGIMHHYSTYKLRKTTIKKNLSAWWWNYFKVVRYQKFLTKS